MWAPSDASQGRRFGVARPPSSFGGVIAMGGIVEVVESGLVIEAVGNAAKERIVELEGRVAQLELELLAFRDELPSDAVIARRAKAQLIWQMENATTTRYVDALCNKVPGYRHRIGVTLVDQRSRVRAAEQLLKSGGVKAADARKLPPAGDLAGLSHDELEARIVALREEVDGGEASGV